MCLVLCIRYSVLRDFPLNISYKRSKSLTRERFNRSSLNRESTCEKYEVFFAASTQSVDAVGADGDEGPPVPFPNTEVKLVCVDNTWWATAREDR